MQDLSGDELLTRVSEMHVLKFPMLNNVAVPKIIRILGKFEDTQYIHLLNSPENHLKFSLPRFSLEFSMLVTGETGKRKLVLNSDGFPGFRLAERQQLDDTLRVHSLFNFGERCGRRKNFNSGRCGVRSSPRRDFRRARS
jgi:hypothetical protein